MSPDSRNSYRVKYPLGYPAALIPRVVLEPGTPVELEDWSEKGLRIRLPQKGAIVVGDEVSLSIKMPDEDEPIAAGGTVVWMDESFAAIQLASLTLPWRILLNEQRAIARWRTKLIEVRDGELG